MARSKLPLATPPRAGGAPRRRKPLTRATPLAPGPWKRPGTRARAPMAASGAQREKISGRWCVVCQQTKGLAPVHLTPRSLGGCDHPDCVVTLCRMHHRAYDSGRLDLLRHLEPRWCAEIAHAVVHVGLLSAYRRLTGGALPRSRPPAR